LNQSRMKVVVRKEYGTPEVLHPEEIEKPTPTDNEVLLKVKATSINKSDWYELTGPFVMRLLGGGFGKPKRQILLSDVAGQVEAVGKNAKAFQPGDEVFGSAHWGLAEYACAREDLLVLKPTNVSFEEAASVPIAAITALQGLRDKGKIQSNQRVLIDGASGGVGSFAVQIAKSFGAEVTAVCSTTNVEQARQMGADHVVDYTKEDFAKNGQRYDLIEGVNGDRSVRGYRNSMADKGNYVMIGGSKAMTQIIGTALLGPLASTGGKKMGFMGIAKLNQKDLVVLKELLQVGKIKPLIDRSYPLDESADAFRYFGEGHVRSKVVITI
jgi:NADPH:quinone reductase-like Zn-dependent oxidoreductase